MTHTAATVLLLLAGLYVLGLLSGAGAVLAYQRTARAVAGQGDRPGRLALFAHRLGLPQPEHALCRMIAMERRPGRRPRRRTFRWCACGYGQRAAMLYLRTLAPEERAQLLEQLRPASAAVEATP